MWSGSSSRRQIILISSLANLSSKLNEEFNQFEYEELIGEIIGVWRLVLTLKDLSFLCMLLGMPDCLHAYLPDFALLCTCSNGWHLWLIALPFFDLFQTRLSSFSSARDSSFRLPRSLWKTLNSIPGRSCTFLRPEQSVRHWNCWILFREIGICYFLSFFFYFNIIFHEFQRFQWKSKISQFLFFAFFADEGKWVGGGGKEETRRHGEGGREYFLNCVEFRQKREKNQIMRWEKVNENNSVVTRSYAQSLHSYKLSRILFGVRRLPWIYNLL